MSVEIKCLSIDSFFYADLIPNDPFFSLHPVTHFFHFCIRFDIQIANFCVLRAHFEKFTNFAIILTLNWQILAWNCIFAHLITPIFGSLHQERSHFYGAHTEWLPSFNKILFSGRHLYVTFIFECPPGGLRYQEKISGYGKTHQEGSFHCYCMTVKGCISIRYLGNVVWIYYSPFTCLVSHRPWKEIPSRVYGCSNVFTKFVPFTWKCVRMCACWHTHTHPHLSYSYTQPNQLSEHASKINGLL